MMRDMRLGAALATLAAIFALGSCSSGDDDEPGASPGSGGLGGSAAADAGDVGVDMDAADAIDAPESAPDVEPPAACSADMLLVEAACIDRYEAPNQVGALPLVMFTFDESEAWCQARGKRLCFDDEWTRSCEGPTGTTYPYGDQHVAGICNDDETWKLYDQSKLNGWPWTVSKPNVESLAQLLEATRAVSASAKVAADHVEMLYQAEPNGSNGGCAGPDGVFDLCGNVEEWTRRRDGGSGKDFTGSLKGRYWAEARTCQNAVVNHGNAFRFYEIGFRCCKDPVTLE